MTHKFKIGDTVRIIKSTASVRIGIITTVISNLKPLGIVQDGDGDNGWFGYPPDMLLHDLDLLPLDGTTNRVAYPPEYLEPYPCVGDGKETIEWTEELKKLCHYNKNVTPIQEKV